MAEAILNLCSDWRFVDNPCVGNFLQQQGLSGKTFKLTSFGAHGTDLNPQLGHNLEDLRTFLRQLNFAIHEGAKEIILTQHEDCGWYAAKFSSLTPTERQERQIQNMKDLREVLLRRLSGIAVRLFWIAIDQSAEGGWRFDVVE